jgi:ABC-type transporter Mla subunit MlaD
MSRSRKMLLLGFAAGVLLLFGIGWLLLGGAPGVSFAVDFNDARGLRAGDKVLLSGLDVGRVQEVKLRDGGNGVEIWARLDSDFANRVPADSRAIIRGGGLTNPFSGKFLELLPPTEVSQAPPLKSGQRLEGLNGDLEASGWKLGQAFAATSEAISRQLEELSASIGDWSDQLDKASKSPEVQKLQNDLQQFATKLEAKGRNAANQAQTQWPGLRDRIRAQKEKLQRDGKTEAAQKLAEVEQQLDQTIDRAKQLAPTPNSPR